MAKGNSLRERHRQEDNRMYDTHDGDFFDTEEGAFDTIMADDIVFNGTMRCKKPFMIRGAVSGKIEASSDLVIDSGAEVRADIEGMRVLLRGDVTGNINARELVFLTPSGQLNGNVNTASLVLEPGSSFNGTARTVARG